MDCWGVGAHPNRQGVHIAAVLLCLKHLCLVRRPQAVLHAWCWPAWAWQNCTLFVYAICRGKVCMC